MDSVGVMGDGESTGEGGLTGDGVSASGEYSVS